MEADKVPHGDIERYVLNQMEQNERLSFEKGMQQSELLSSEVAFQKNILGGLAEARKAMLKSRLSEIPVSSSWYSHALHSTWAKVAGGVIVASAASILTYMQVREPMDTEPNAIVDIAAPKYYSEVEIVLPEEEELNVQVEEPIVVQKSVTAEVSSIKPDEAVVEKVSAEEPVLDIPELILPDMGDAETIAADETNADEALPDLSGEPAVTLELIEGKGIRSYRYFDGELILKGDFSEVIYDLLELNNSEGKQYFLEIKGKYYALPVSADFRPIELINDRALITSLQMLATDN